MSMDPSTLDPTDQTDPVVQIVERAQTDTKAPPQPPPVVKPPGTTGGGGSSSGGSSSSSGSSSGGSSSGSSAPAVDPVVIAAKESMFQSVYTQMWGEPASKGYLAAAANSGMNVWEFADRERHKPAFRLTETYRNKGDAFASLFHSLGVA